MDKQNEQKPKKVLGKNVQKLIITTCRQYFSTDEELIEKLNDKLEAEKEYTIEEIKQIVTELTTDENGKRKPEVRRNKTMNEIAPGWNSKEYIEIEKRL